MAVIAEFKVVCRRVGNKTRTELIVHETKVIGKTKYRRIKKDESYQDAIMEVRKSLIKAMKGGA